MSKTKIKAPVTYYLTLSQVFPSTHCRAGGPTGFKEAFVNGQDTERDDGKLHTIRANYDFWARRFEKIERGEAVLSIREWVGKPYGKGSTQREIARLTRDDGIGLQRLEFVLGTLSNAYIDLGNHLIMRYATQEELARNDGLSLNDWREWFMGYDLSKPMAIIHFTKFRY